MQKNLSFSFSQAELGHAISKLSIKRKSVEDNSDDAGSSKRSKCVNIGHDGTISTHLLPPPSPSVSKTKRRNPRKFKSVFPRKTLKSESPSMRQNLQSISVNLSKVRSI